MLHRLLGNRQVKPLDDVYNYMLRTARLDRGYSMGELAVRTGVSLSTISAYERLRAYPSEETAQKVASALGREVQGLFPEVLREYVRQTRIERYGNKQDVLQHAVHLTKRGERRLEDKTGETQEAVAARKELAARIDGVLNSLTPREREIIKMRYGLADGCVYTLEEVRKVFKTTRERIREIEAKAVRKLQQPSRSQRLTGCLD